MVTDRDKSAPNAVTSVLGNDPGRPYSCGSVPPALFPYAMQLLGIPLRRPKFGELTASAVMATGLWLAVLGFVRAAQMPMDRMDAGALLLVVAWGCVSARLGIRIGMGHRHLLANLLVSGALLLVYQSAWAIAG